ncbi:MAG: type IV pilus assembly protein PilM [Candidatus Saccharimonadales bacterium]
MKDPLFYHKRPLFGLDVGSQTVKFLQLEHHGKHSATVKAFGSIVTDEKIMNSGAITNIPKAAKLIDTLLDEHVTGALTTNRTAMSVPVSRAFTRVVMLPHMSPKELRSAVQLEVEQSIPLPSKDLYFDYETADIDDPENHLVSIVAVPRAIIDSYVGVCDLLGLELVLAQTNISADGQLCRMFEGVDQDSPHIIVDVGGDSIDIGILDSTVRVTATVDEGGNSLTKSIAAAQRISYTKANALKVEEGIASGKNQMKIKKAVTPILNKVVHEIIRMQKFYQERVHEDGEILQILIVGGGANMPGLGDYLTDATHIPSRVSSPWSNNIHFGRLEPPEFADLPRFLTCAGLALAQEDEVFER